MSVYTIIGLLAGFAAILTFIITFWKMIKKYLKETLFVSLIISLGFNIYFLLQKEEIKPDLTKYGFEMGTMGWRAQTYKDSRGISTVNQYQNKSYLGQYSLELKADLVGGDSSRHKGESYTELSEPVNFENKTISYYFYLPCPSQAAGNPDHPNGFQAFVKDIKFRSEYGRWINIYPTDKGWKQIRFTPSHEEPENGHMDADFDPTKIIMLGLKMAIGDSSKAKYKGSIFIDSINW